MSVPVFRCRSSYRRWRSSLDVEFFVKKGRAPRVGFVPTMGALHSGHLSLARRASAENDAAVASIYVNPAQFGPNEDFDRYPKDEENDVAGLRQAGVAAILAPAGSLYSGDHGTAVDPEFLARGTCPESEARPGFFRGVATVCTKFFHVVRPTHVYFGQKDAVQCVVIRRLLEDLDFAPDIQLVVCPTERESDGLAMSSRNRYLSDTERPLANVLYRALSAIEQAVGALRSQSHEPATDASLSALREVGHRVASDTPQFRLQYLSFASGTNALELESDEQLRQAFHQPDGFVLSGAGMLGNTRLIDNLIIKP